MVFRQKYIPMLLGRFKEEQPAMAPPARITGAAVTVISFIGLLSYIILNNNRSRLKSSNRKVTLKKPRSGLVAAIGNTPLIRINSLSDATGCEVIIRL